MKKLLLSIALLILAIIAPATAQMRIAVLPFINMDGNMKFNIWCYQLSDSLTKALLAEDPEEKYYSIVPSDSVEAVLAALNVDPTNPQYPTDMWKAVESLNVKYVVSGNFNFQARRFLVNGYVYDVDLKLPNLEHRARDIFKKEEQLYESIRIIVKALLPAIKKD